MAGYKKGQQEGSCLQTAFTEEYVQGLGASGGSSREDSTRPHPLVVAPLPP